MIAKWDTLSLKQQKKQKQKNQQQNESASIQGGARSTTALFFRVVSGSFPLFLKENSLSCLCKLLGSFQLLLPAERLITADSLTGTAAGGSPTLPTPPL